MWHYDPEIEGGVTIFSGDQCGTYSKFLPASQNSDQVGFAFDIDMKQSGMGGASQATAITVPPGYKAIIYKDEKFGGDLREFRGALNDWEGAECQKVPNNMRGWKSIKIIRDDKTPNARSSWIQIGNGYDAVNLTAADKISDDDAIWDQLEMGVDHQYKRAIDSISHKWVYDVQTMTNAANHITYEYMMGVWCPEKLDAAGVPLDVGMWLYVVQSDDRKTTLSHPPTRVCRYGTLWNETPQCPLPACKDIECSQCNGWKQG